MPVKARIVPVFPASQQQPTGWVPEIRVMSLTANPTERDVGSPQFTKRLRQGLENLRNHAPGVHWDTPGILIKGYTALKKRRRE